MPGGDQRICDCSKCTAKCRSQSCLLNQWPSLVPIWDYVQLLVHPIGTKVTLANNVEAIIIEICISTHKTMYKVVWWDKTTRTEVWINDIEIGMFDQAKTVQIGFK